MGFIAAGSFFAGRFLDFARNDRGTWQHCISWRQETIHAEFLIRLDTIVFLTAGEADSIHIESAVHIQGGAGDEAGVVGGEEGCGCCYVFRLCHLS